MIKHSIPLHEPQRGKDLLTQVNTAFVGNETSSGLAPMLTDGLVFTYPFLLVIWYLRGVSKESSEIRLGALYVFTSVVVATVVNIAVQYLVDKQRPEGYIENKNLLIMDHLPTAPFPSDHAAVGFAIAFATILRAAKQQNKILLMIGVLLFIGAIIMSIARVGVAIHRPTDVIAGALIGLLCAVVIHPMIYQESQVAGFLFKLIEFQEWIFAKIKF